MELSSVGPSDSRTWESRAVHELLSQHSRGYLAISAAAREHPRRGRGGPDATLRLFGTMTATAQFLRSREVFTARANPEHRGWSAEPTRHASAGRSRIHGERVDSLAAVRCHTPASAEHAEKPGRRPFATSRAVGVIFALGRRRRSRMSQKDVERTLGRLLTDASFRRDFFQDPARACARQARPVGPSPRTSARRVLQVAGATARRPRRRSSTNRICRLSIDDVDGDGSPTEDHRP